MTHLILVVLDTVGIQPYIFGSNRLRENVGASHLVHQATSGWLLENPNAFLPERHNIVKGNRVDNDAGIEAGALDAELIYAGGGNTVILFREPADARRFAGELSRKILQEAPGLEAVMVSEPLEWSGSLARAVKTAMSRLATKKAEREWPQPLLGLGVTAACESTGLVGNYVEPEPGEPPPGQKKRRLVISAEVMAKWDQKESAKERLRQELWPEGFNGLDFPDQFDHLGRTEGELSYIAVVHADGNNMGKVLEGITDKYLDQTGPANREYMDRLRDFSVAVNKAGSSALKQVVANVLKWNTSGEIEPKKVNGKKYLSIRPLVYGGDDVTYVCDGRIGLRTAQVFLEAFGQHKIRDGNDNLILAKAAAGVCIVKVRYPFARAYQLSEQLCKNAKNWSKREALALDWHLAQSGLFGGLRAIRGREYDEVWEDGKVIHSLLMRPVTVGRSGGKDWHTWANFSTVLRRFRDRDKWPRNKVMVLREALRDGPDSVSSFVDNYRRDLPEIAIDATRYRKTGWDGGRCVYFDAIEMIEQEVPA